MVVDYLFSLKILNSFISFLSRLLIFMRPQSPSYLFALFCLVGIYRIVFSESINRIYVTAFVRYWISLIILLTFLAISFISYFMFFSFPFFSSLLHYFYIIFLPAHVFFFVH